MEYLQLPENPRDTPWNIRLLICNLFILTLNTVLVVALLASLGGVASEVSVMIPEMRETLKDVRTMLPEMTTSLDDLHDLAPKARDALKILDNICTRVKC